MQPKNGHDHRALLKNKQFCKATVNDIQRIEIVVFVGCTFGDISLCSAVLLHRCYFLVP